MCDRFQTGSNRPLANRNARMLSTDSLPRKWSIRKICDSSKTACTALPSSTADFRSVPKGFSMITRDLSLARPAAPSMPTTDGEGRRRHGEVEQAPHLAADLLLGLLAPRPSAGS